MAQQAPILNESLRQRLMRRMSHLKTDRSSWETHWRELADYMAPRRGRWALADHNRGQKMHDRIMDGTPLFAARTLASGMMAGLTSPARPWFRLATPDPELSERAAVKVWLYAVENRMRDLFQKSNLYNVLPVIYGDLGVFGTACMLALEDEETVVRFVPLPIGSYWLATNYRLEVDTVYREFRYTVRQTVQEFGLEACSDRVRGLAQGGNWEAPVDIYHAIETNNEQVFGRADASGMPFRSVYWEKGGEKDQVLAVRGFRESPVLAPRWNVVGEDVYGYSPGMDALGDSKALMLQQIRKAEAIDKMVDPPMGAPTSLRNSVVSMLPGDVTYFDTQQGGSGVRPLYEVKPDINALVADIAETQQRINTAFYADLFLMLSMSDRRQITAREIEERHEEKLLMLGPVLERLDDELLGPMIDRTFGIMMRAGLLPEPPPELEGVDLKVEYISILAQAQKMVGIGAVDRLSGFVGQLAGIWPEARHKFDAQQAVDEYADMLGVSPRLVRPDDAVAELEQADAQAQAAAQMGGMAKMMRDGAGAVKDLSQAPVGPDGEQTALSALAGALGGPA